MNWSGVIIAIVTASIGGGLVGLLLLPRQKRQMDAALDHTRVQTASVIIDQLQEDLAGCRAEIQSLRNEVHRLRRQLFRVTGQWPEAAEESAGP